MFKLTDYYKPTPAKWRKFGDSLLLGCLGVINYVSVDVTTLRIVVTCMILSKFITNFFTEDK